MPDPPAGRDAAIDPRIAVERAFADADQLLLYAPPADVVEEVLAREPVSDEWFGVTETQATSPPVNRRERLVRLAEAFDAQGIAWVRQSRPGSSEVQIALAAPGGAEPDVLTVVLDQPESVNRALDRLKAPLVLFHGSAGIVAIDVLDLKASSSATLTRTVRRRTSGSKPATSSTASTAMRSNR